MASVLWRLGFEVSVTMGHTKEIDLFAKKMSSFAIIDVKGVKQAPFLVQRRDAYDEHGFYIFVLWQKSFQDPNKAPRCFIVPASDLPLLLSPIPSWGTDTKGVNLKDVLKYESKWELLMR